MKRIGILDVNVVTEKLVRGLFLAIPDVQLFISPGFSETAQALASEFPCWTMDTNQGVIDEAEIIIINSAADELKNLAETIQLKNHHTIVSLIPGIQTRTLCEQFKHPRCIRLMITNAVEINKSAVFITAASDETLELFSMLGQLIVFTRESDFNIAAVSLCMNSWLYFLADGFQSWFIQNGISEGLARNMVLAGMKDCVEYASNKDSTSLNDLWQTVNFFRDTAHQGIAVLAQQHALAPWKAASDKVLNEIETFHFTQNQGFEDS